MKSLHAKLKLVKEGDDKQDIAEQLVTLDNQRADNWLKIDKF